MSEPSLNSGDTVRLSITIRDEDSVITDPSTLSVIVLSPMSGSTTYSHPDDAQVVREDEGEFHVDVLLDSSGIWKYEWSSTVPTMVEGEQFYVGGSSLTSLPDQASVADYAKMYLGGENWDELVKSPNFGMAQVLLAIDVVKRRVLANPPPSPVEFTLNKRLLDYLGILSAIQLIPAARDAFANRIISKSVGNDSAEIETYTDRARMIGEQLKDLLARVPAIRDAALPDIDDPVASTMSRPAIDELDDYRVMPDPRRFPPEHTFPDLDPERV